MPNEFASPIVSAGSITSAKTSSPRRHADRSPRKAGPYPYPPAASSSYRPSTATSTAPGGGHTVSSAAGGRGRPGPSPSPPAASPSYRPSPATGPAPGGGHTVSSAAGGPTAGASCPLACRVHGSAAAGLAYTSTARGPAGSSGSGGPA